MLNRKYTGVRSMGACVYAHLSSWLHSPRTMIMGIVILFSMYINARNFGFNLSVQHHTAHLGEAIFTYLNQGFKVEMTTVFLLVMVSEIPKRIAFQNTMLLRISRKKWLASQILFCVTVVVLMITLLTAFCTVISLPYIEPGSGWSDLERLAADPDYQYEFQLVPEYIRGMSPFGACLCAAAVLFSFWITMLLVILLFSIFGQPNLGMLIYVSIIQFALTVRYEWIGIHVPTDYATLGAVAYQFSGRELEYLPKVLGVYVLIDLAMIVCMTVRVHHTDLCFNGKE